MLLEEEKWRSMLDKERKMLFFLDPIPSWGSAHPNQAHKNGKY